MKNIEGKVTLELNVEAFVILFWGLIFEGVLIALGLVIAAFILK